MGIYLIVLIVVLLYFNTNLNIHHREDFLGEYKSLLSDDPINEYYTDRDGRKGVLFRQLYDYPLYISKKVKKRNPEQFQSITKRLELYSNNVYKNCKSSVSP
jgi:hypothetical protein